LEGIRIILFSLLFVHAWFWNLEAFFYGNLQLRIPMKASTESDASRPVETKGRW